MTGAEPRVRIGDVDCRSASVRALADLDLARADRHRAVLRSSAQQRETIRLLTLDGGSLRAIARLVGLSYQRVQQIVDELRRDCRLPPTEGTP